MRKVRTASGSVAVQLVTGQGRQLPGIEHVGSAHTDEELALLLAGAKARLYRAVTPRSAIIDIYGQRLTIDPELPVVP